MPDSFQPSAVLVINIDVHEDERVAAGNEVI